MGVRNITPVSSIILHLRVIVGIRNITCLKQSAHCLPHKICGIKVGYWGKMASFWDRTSPGKGGSLEVWGGGIEWSPVGD